MFKLRYYQENAINFAMQDLKQGKNVLLNLTTGCGKSVVIAGLIKKIKEEQPYSRCLMCVMNSILVEQNYEKLKNDLDVGIYSAGLGKKELNKDITFATINSIYNKEINDIGYYDYLLIDECHNISDKNTGMYRELINKLTKINSNLKIIGLTATIFRSGSGLITKGENRLFDHVTYEYGYEQALNDGFVAPLRSKITINNDNLIKDLASIKVSAGEYNLKELDFLMTNEERTQKAVAEALKYLSERNRCLWFCSSLKHTEMVIAELKKHNETCDFLIGTDKKEKKDRIKKDFHNGVFRHLVSVNMITTGFDEPEIDALITLRPTKSPVLFMQALGRGTRMAANKKDCLFLDFAGWTAEFGSIFDIKTVAQYNKETKTVEELVVKKLNNTRICPECREVIARNLKVCPHCNFEFTTEEILKNDIKPSELDIMAKYDKTLLPVIKMDIVSPYICKNNGAKCVKLIYTTPTKDVLQFLFSWDIQKFVEQFVPDNQEVNNWLKERGYRDYYDFLRTINLDCLKNMENFFRKPKTIKVKKVGQYDKIFSVLF